jgi:hypothetical protein
VQYNGSGKAGSSDRLGPAADRRLAHADDADEQGDRLRLSQQEWKAGKYKIAFQACNDASAQLAKWDPDEVQRERACLRQ